MSQPRDLSTRSARLSARYVRTLLIADIKAITSQIRQRTCDVKSVQQPEEPNDAAARLAFHIRVWKMLGQNLGPATGCHDGVCSGLIQSRYLINGDYFKSACTVSCHILSKSLFIRSHCPEKRLFDSSCPPVCPSLSARIPLNFRGI